MGAQNSTSSGLDEVTARVQERVGKLQVTGRYHRGSKKLEHDYKLSKKVLGSGYNGQVLMGRSIGSNQDVAIKAFKLHGVSKEKKLELQSECEIFLAMDHPHVARLVDVYEDEDCLQLVMECMSGGELFKRVVAQKRFTEKDAADAAWQMLLAINYIHSHGIVHRDLKLENFLYDTPNSTHLKLIDFGFSKIWQPNTKMAASCGTLAYVAPEVLRQSYTSKCDMWSFGVTIFIVLFGYMPFSGAEDVQVRAIKDGQYKVKRDVWSKVSENAQDFVKKLLVVNVDKRMSAEEALKHTWIQERERLEDTHLDQGVIEAFQKFGQESAFRRACMSMMAWSLTNEERAKVRKAFIEMDVERTGAIKLAEFKQVLEKKFNMTDEETAETFRALDINNTDEIHYSEFLAAMVSSRIQLHDDLLMGTFKRFDTDNSGYITTENLKEVLGETFDGEQVAELVKEADFSGDNKISYQEFIEYLRGGEAAGTHHAEAAARVIDKAMEREGNARVKKLRMRSSVGSSGNVPRGDQKSGGKDKGQSCKCTLL